MQYHPDFSNTKRSVLCLGATVAVLCSVVTASALPVVWINEIHYDNTGTDVGEFVEVAGVAGTLLSGYQLVLYNGGNGTAYSTLNLSGTLSDQQNGFGAAAFTFAATIQNGSADGIALISPGGEIQFLSYEGVFTAVGGPANGIASTDIGVLQAGTDPVGQSLQLTGAGTSYADFTWSAPAPATAGSINNGQSFPAASVPDGGATLGLLTLGLLSLRVLRARRS
jgi:hypothetical protein